MSDLLQLPSATKLLLLTYILSLGCTVFLFFRQSNYWKYALFCAAFFLAASFSLFMPFLNIWDEQFHALVAKNMLQNPLHPRLFLEDVRDVTTTNWVMTGTWLHKQPLFLWVMSLSVKLFGSTIFAARFPSMLLHGLMTCASYKIGRNLFDKKTGLIMAVLIMHSGYLLGLITGKNTTDHNDVFFLGFVLFSFWTFTEYLQENKRKWAYLTGVFAGCAVMTKWLVGLLVFAPWGIIAIAHIIQYRQYRVLLDQVRAFLITLLVFLPWQVYIFLRFPKEAALEMELNAIHFHSPVEKHGGDFLFHFDQLTELYFFKWDFLIVLLISSIILIWKKVKWQSLLIPFSIIFIVYLFFTLAATKMPSFTIPAYPMVLLIFAAGITAFASFFKNQFLRIGTQVVCVIFFVFHLFNPDKVMEEYAIAHDSKVKEAFRMRKVQNEFIRNNDNPKRKRVVFGCELRGYAYVQWMYFTHDIAYPFYPSKSDISRIQKRGFHVALIDWNHSIPKELVGLKDVEILHYWDK